jgi:hypothetical protein
MPFTVVSSSHFIADDSCRFIADLCPSLLLVQATSLLMIHATSLLIYVLHRCNSSLVNVVVLSRVIAVVQVLPLLSFVYRN